MLLIVGAVVGLLAVVLIARLRVPNGVKAGTLGRMSEQWMTRHPPWHSR